MPVIYLALVPGDGSDGSEGGDGSEGSYGDTPDTGALLCLAVPPLTSPGVAQLDEVRPVESLEDS